MNKKLTIAQRIIKHQNYINKLLKKISYHKCQIEKLKTKLDTDKPIEETEYQKLLRKKEWKEKRKEIFALQGKFCVKCGTNKRLRVHHKYYLNGRLPWEYPNDAFMVLCEDCHKKEHGLD